MVVTKYSDPWEINHLYEQHAVCVRTRGAVSKNGVACTKCIFITLL